jgi:UDP-2,3-diacylglucosamine hydrolase
VTAIDLPAPAYIISDAHIGLAPPGSGAERALLAFLAHLDSGSLLINGDLFDFWFEWRTVIPRAGFRVIAALADLRERGVPIVWIAGNHDCWGGDILRRDVGVDYHVGPWDGRLGGWRTRVEHGDGLRPRADRGYRAIRGILRNPLAIRAFRWLPADVASRLATGSSQASRTYRAPEGGAGLKAVAAERLAGNDAPELLVFAHSHVATVERLGRGVYANAGAWSDDSNGPGPTYLVVTPERIALRVWTSAQPQLLDSIDHAVLAQEPATGAEKMLGRVGGDEPVGR